MSRPVDPQHESTRAEIESRLRDALQPERLEVRDHSWKHVGHPGATSGGGHYDVEIVAARFEGLSRLDRHRLVNQALADLFGPRIHALKLKTRAPGED